MLSICKNNTHKLENFALEEFQDSLHFSKLIIDPFSFLLEHNLGMVSCWCHTTTSLQKQEEPPDFLSLGMTTLAMGGPEEKEFK